MFNPRPPEFYLPYRGDSAGLAPAYARYLAAYRESLEVLKRPLPDTFLGRKTQEPLSLES